MHTAVNVSQDFQAAGVKQVYVSFVLLRTIPSIVIVKVESLSRVRLFATPWTSLPGSSVHGIFQAIVLEWIAISFSSGSSRPSDGTQVSRVVDRRFTV